MELRRVVDALLRLQASPLASFLTPSTSTRWTTGRQLSYKQPSNRSAQRSFITSSRRYALKPQATTSAAPTPTPQPNASSTTEQDKISKSMEEITKSLNWATPGVSRSRSPISRSQEERFNGGTSASDLLAEFNNQRSSSRTSPSSAFDMSQMLAPRDSSGISPSMQAGILSELKMPPPKKVEMKLNPSTGRSVTIGSGIDIGRGIRMLEQSCARNRIKADANRQRFHERGGLKRKRLRRERWRKRFLEGFKATVGRVKQLKNQGW